ncbi:MAG: type IV pilus modification protein PilV [Metallibacterium scheffleri]|jgi:type IV pilus assembly protein PilV|uniref:type IV pilus modification protein PilV n=1 Tax=Metallibacterium scheffleri TaxID=993689 RepID=UPI0026F16028|nr:type IV pilus modification protein PilV [Metallibacterium scheffleri]MCK9365589.1 type IV pilus modification protein PilV [Metallibacterium scheffleri]
MKRPLRAAGFTLLEVLVTVVILSIGMLGVAGVLLLVHKNNAASYMQQQAVQDAYDILDRMRANRSAALQGLYDVAPPSSAPTSCSSNTCSPQQMANYDLWQWHSDLVNELPAATSNISTATPAGVSSANQDVQVTVKLQWSDAPTLQALKQTVKPASYTLTTVL